MNQTKLSSDAVIGFWGKSGDNGFMSNFYNVKFTTNLSDLPLLKNELKQLNDLFGDVLQFCNSEQYFMLMKAVTFYNEEVNLPLIIELMNETDPKIIKGYGRKVNGFNQKVWDKVKYKHMLNANLQKFGQNEALKQKLLATGDKLLVEAATNDKIWGIGMTVEHEDFLFPDKWKGTNLLGKVLMDVRAKLK